MNMVIQNSLLLPRMKNTDSTCSNTDSTSIVQQTATDMLPLVRSGILSRGISERAADIIIQSWRYGTQKQYRTYLQR